MGDKNPNKQGVTGEGAGVESARAFLTSFRREEAKRFFWYVLSLVILVAVLMVALPWLVTLPGVVCLRWLVAGIFQLVSAEAAAGGMEQSLQLTSGPDAASVLVALLVVVYVAVDFAFEAPWFFNGAPLSGRGLERVKAVLLWATALLFVWSLVLGIGVDMLRQAFATYGDAWLTPEDDSTIQGVLFLAGGMLCSVIGALGAAWWSRRRRPAEKGLPEDATLRKAIFYAFRSAALFLKRKTAGNGVARWLVLVASIAFAGIALPLVVAGFVAAALFAFAVSFGIFLLVFALGAAARR